MQLGLTCNSLPTLLTIFISQTMPLFKLLLTHNNRIRAFRYEQVEPREKLILAILTCDFDEINALFKRLNKLNIDFNSLSLVCSCMHINPKGDRPSATRALPNSSYSRQLHRSSNRRFPYFWRSIFVTLSNVVSEIYGDCTHAVFYFILFIYSNIRFSNSGTH